MSATARSRSASGITTIAFFPDVSANSGVAGAIERKSSAVSNEPVRMIAVDAVVGDQVLADAAVGAANVLERRRRGTPPSQHACAISEGGAGRLRRRLEDHGVAGGQRREHSAGGNGEREVPGRDDRDDTEWFEFGAVAPSSSAMRSA